MACGGAGTAPGVPETCGHCGGDGRVFEGEEDTGLTKREYFAAAAAQGIGANGGYTTFKDMAKDAVSLADALIEALNK